jgi:uroporphyrin-III C-methyltransferase
VPAFLDLTALARGADVLVFYMALRQAGVIAARLLAAGRAPNDAVAFISDATTPRQRVTVATLASTDAVANTLDRSRPTLIVIGPVMALRPMIVPLLQATPMTLAPDSAAQPGFAR